MTACGHSFHVECLSVDGFCSICSEPLQKIAKDLSHKFNEGLMKEEEKNLGKSTSTTVDSTNDEIKLTSPTEGERYYTSVVWQQKIQGIVDSYNGVRHPTKAITWSNGRGY